jgi:hypothetical protein
MDTERSVCVIDTQREQPLRLKRESHKQATSGWGTPQEGRLCTTQALSLLMMIRAALSRRSMDT